MNRFLKFLSFVLVAFVPACAGVSEIKKGTETPVPSSTVMVKTNFGGYINKKVLSVREMRYKNIVPQQFDFSCGASSLATILKYLYGMVDIKEVDIVKDMIEKGDMEKIRQKGFSLLDMKKYAERQGFQANGYKVKVENLPKLKIPVIVLTTTAKGYTHFVVLKGIKNGRVYLADPAMGNKSALVKEFVKSWDGVVFLVYKKTDKELTLALDTDLRPPIENVLRFQEIGMRNYVRLPGEF